MIKLGIAGILLIAGSCLIATPLKVLGGLMIIGTFLWSLWELLMGVVGGDDGD